MKKYRVNCLYLDILNTYKHAVVICFAALQIAGLILIPLFAQEGDLQRDVEQQNEVLSRGFGLIALGMSMEEVKEKLKEDPHFNFRGDPDVTMLQRPNESLIETPGFYYVDRAFFQFFDNQLHTIIMLLNTQRIDHYSIFTTFSRNYGPPVDLSPQRALWDDGVTSISLERPLRVKYMDKATYQQIRGETTVPESPDGTLRRYFLDQF